MPFGRFSLPVRRLRGFGALCAVMALALSLAACGGDDEEKEEPNNPAETAATVQLNGMWPLTGEKLEGDLPDHPVYVVKIDNTASSAPQVGLGSADLVVEELVEGGLTRLAVFFYSELPEDAGPVRSLRATDIGIVKPVNSVVVASGGAKVTVNRLRAAGLKTLTEGADGFYREDSRHAPYNLMMRLKDAKPGDWKPPVATYLPFGDAADFTGTRPVRKIATAFSGGRTTNFTLTDKGWVRPGSYAAKNDDFVADNVLILRVKMGDAGYLDPAGNPVPETILAGKGQAVLVHGGKALTCTWKKKGKGGTIQLLSAGKKVTVPAGRTWIGLVPATGGNVTLAK